MSKTVDERIVSMQFDNKHFESNVSTTMSTLDKLKQKLKFTDSSKGLDDLGKSVKNVDMSGLGTAVDTVRTRFSALEVMGVTALANITNSAVNAGKRMVSALTIDPIKTGFNEYETKINSIQTIMSNTASKGTTMEDVTRVIDELNTYADKTIYNFTEMTRNIGTFTAAGVGLEESASAIQGIANLAAASGSTSQQASTAMYQLSQALAAGTVKLMDWNSVVNAGMGGEKFQEALKATARDHGIAVDDIIEKNGSFRDSLQDGWISADILNETLNKFTVDGAKNYAKSMVDAGKWTKEQADALVKEAQSMEDAATKVKTFTQLWDTLKESAQSGWSKTWELIIGDFDEAKNLFTGLSDFLGGFINKMSDARNFIVEGVMNISKPWQTIMDKLNGAGFGGIKKIADTVKDATDKLEYFQDVVNKVWHGDYKNSDTGRYELLAADGYDSRVVQDLVNKGQGYKLTVEDIEESHKKFGLTMETTTKSTEKATDVLANLSDEQLKNAGLTDDEIKLYRDLAEEADRTGVSIGELVDKMSKKDGRTLLIESFKNAGNGLVGIFKAIKNAWSEIFPAPSIVRIYNIIAAINEFSEKLVLVDKETGELTDTAKKFQRIFKGIFALVDIVATIMGGAFKIAFKAASALLGMFGMDVIDVIAYIADAIVVFRDWIDSLLDFTKIFEKMAPTVKKAFSGIMDWFNGLKNSDNLTYDIITGIANGLVQGVKFIGSAIWKLGSSIGKYLKGVFKGESTGEVALDFIKGFVLGIYDGVKIIGSAIIELGKTALSKLREAIDSHSPSRATYEIGGDFMAGFFNGIKEWALKIWGYIKGFGQKCVDILKGIDFGAVFAGILSTGMTVAALKIAKTIEALGAPLEGIGDVLSGTGEILEKAAKPIKKILNNTAKVVKSFSKVMNSFAFSIKAKAMKDIALALLILVGAVAVLTFLDPDKLWKAVGVIVVLAGVLVGLAVATELLSKASVSVGKDGAKIDGLKAGLIKMAAAMLILGIVVKMIGSMDPDKAKQGFIGLAGMAVGMLVFVAGLAAIERWIGKTSLDEIGSTMLKLAGAIAIIALIAKMISGVGWESLGKVGAIAGGILVLVAGFAAIERWIGKASLDKIGPTMLKIAGAIAIIGLVAMLITIVKWESLGKVGAIAGGIIALVLAFALIEKYVGTSSSDIGKTMLGIAGAIAILALVARMLAGMEWKEMGRAGVGLLGLVGIVYLLVRIVKMAGTDAPKIAATLLAMSVAIGIIAGIAVLLGFVSIPHLAKGIIAVGILAALMSLMIWATRGASDCKGNLIVMTVAIGIMAAAVAALSMIKPEKLIPAAGAMAVLMGMFALMTFAAKNIQSGMGVLIVLTVAVGVLAGIVYMLSGLPVENVLGTAIAMSALMLAMAGVLAILNLIGRSGGSALAGAGLLLLLAVPLVAFVGILALMNNVQNAIQNAIVLSAFTTAMVLVLGGLALIGSLGALGALAGVLLLTSLAIPLCLFINIIAALNNIQNAEANAKLLTNFMLVMTGMLVVLAIVGPLAMAGVGAMAALTLLLVGIGALAVAIGALMEKFPAVEEFLNTGLPILEQLATSIGTIIGNIVGGFLESVSGTLPTIGENLSLFMDNIQGFIEGAKNIDSNVLAGIGYLSGAIIALTVADLIAGISSFIQFGSSFADLGLELSAFMINAAPFITGAAMLNPEMVAGVRSLAETILILTAANVLEGLARLFGGGNSLEAFGAQLPGLGSNLSTFATNLGSFDESTVTTVTCAANAIKAIAEAADNLPNEGGWAAKLLGDNSIATFGSYLPTLGTNLSEFATNLGTFDDSKVQTVTCAANAIKAMAEAADKLPNEGGWAAKILGDNSIATFGSYLPGLGTNLSEFATNLGTFTDEQVTTVGCAANAIKTMAEAADKIPNEGGWVAKLVGDNSIATFAGHLPGLGTNLKNFAANLGTFSDDKVATVNSSIKAVSAFAKLADVDLKAAKKQMDGFGEKMVDFGGHIASFASKMSETDISTISLAATKINKIIDILQKTAGVDASAADNFKNALKTLGESGVKSFTDALTSGSTTTELTAAGTKMVRAANKGASEELVQFKKSMTEGVKAIVNGIKTELKNISNIFSDAVATAAAAVGSITSYTRFYSAGQYLADGFAAGIDANDYKAEAKARAMAKAAAEAAEDELGIESPSKVTYGIGNFFGLGFVNAVGDSARSAYKAGSNMAASAREGLSNAISKVSDFLNSDMDTQPTIRPVLDLSNVESGVGALNGMFGMNPSVGVISTMMNRRSQNGANDDVVSAIDKLRRDMSSMDRTSYNINGITYEQGSDVADAIETLVRAATKERRT